MHSRRLTAINLDHRIRFASGVFQRNWPSLPVRGRARLPTATSAATPAMVSLQPPQRKPNAANFSRLRPSACMLRFGHCELVVSFESLAHTVGSGFYSITRLLSQKLVRPPEPIGENILMWCGHLNSRGPILVKQINSTIVRVPIPAYQSKGAAFHAFRNKTGS